MLETYMINMYTGELLNSSDFKAVELDYDQLEQLQDGSYKQRIEFAANNGRFISEGEQ